MGNPNSDLNADLTRPELQGDAFRPELARLGSSQNSDLKSDLDSDLNADPK